MMASFHLYRSCIIINIHYGMCLGPYRSQMCVLQPYQAQNQRVRSIAHTSTSAAKAYRFLMDTWMVGDRSTTKTVGFAEALTIPLTVIFNILMQLMIQ